MNRSLIIRLLCVLAVVLLVACSCDLNPNVETSSETESASIEESSEGKTEASQSASETESEEATESTTAKPSKVTYTVTVVDEEGNPISGATVQLCVGDLCKLPSPTNADGVATFEFDEAEYTVKVTVSGYTGEDHYEFPEGSSELTVTLTAN